MSRLVRATVLAWVLAAAAGGSQAAAAPGDLTQKPGTPGCLADTGIAGVCADGTALNTPRAVTVSPDGVSVYVAAINSGAIDVLDRLPDGSIVQKPGTAGCISNNGTGGACFDGAGLSGVRGLAVSPDGTSVYGAAYVTDAIAILDRDANGALTQKAGTAGCISDNGTGACVDGTALNGAAAVAISPDGTSVYIAAQDNDAVVAFDRASDGALTQKAGAAGCITLVAQAPCATGAGLDEPRGIAVSRDGKSVYVASGVSDTLTVFDRAIDGTLTQKPGATGCLDDGGDAPCADVTGLDGAFGVTVSPDGFNVYAASQFSDAVTVFDRAADGALTQKPLTAGCVSNDGSAGACADGDALDGARNVALSPDGLSAYVASDDADAVTVLDRAADGGLTQHVAPAGCVSNDGTNGTCADGAGLDGAFGVAVSPGGTSAYVVSQFANAVSVFDREPFPPPPPPPPPPPVVPPGSPPPANPPSPLSPPPPSAPAPRAQPGCPLRGTQLAGTARDDTLAGRALSIDILFGLAGDDRLRGRDGRDCLYGGDGDDRLYGGRGADRLFGGSGADALDGEDGVDNLDGADAREGHGGDRLDGGPGRDRLRDRRGGATLAGGAGDDRIDARDASARDRRVPDTITCGSGRDTVLADAADRVARDCERVTRRRAPRGAG